MARGKTCRHYMRIVYKVLDELVEIENAEFVMECLQAIRKFISELQKINNAEAPRDSVKDSQTEQLQLEHLKRQYHIMQ